MYQTIPISPLRLTYNTDEIMSGMIVTLNHRKAHRYVTDEKVVQSG